MTITSQWKRSVPRLLLFALLVNIAFTITADTGSGGDGGATIPYPAPLPIPNGPSVPPPDTLADTTQSVMQ